MGVDELPDSLMAEDQAKKYNEIKIAKAKKSELSQKQQEYLNFYTDLQKKKFDQKRQNVR